MKTNVEVFDHHLLAYTNKDRQEVYGHPIDHFARVAKMQEVVIEMPDPELRHAANMICDKLARLVHSPEHIDSWIDIAGYARTAVMILAERADQNRSIEINDTDTV